MNYITSTEVITLQFNQLAEILQIELHGDWPGPDHRDAHVHNSYQCIVFSVYTTSLVPSPFRVWGQGFFDQKSVAAMAATAAMLPTPLYHYTKCVLQIFLTFTIRY